jgi:hypothetical protein
MMYLTFCISRGCTTTHPEYFSLHFYNSAAKVAEALISRSRCPQRTMVAEQASTVEKPPAPGSVSTPDQTSRPTQDQTHGKETVSSNKVIAEKTTENNEEADDDYEYITGIKLLIVVSAVTLVAFLMLLDTSIIATVSRAEIIRGTSPRAYIDRDTRLSRGSQAISILFMMWDGMAAHI